MTIQPCSCIMLRAYRSFATADANHAAPASPESCAHTDKCSAQLHTLITACTASRCDYSKEANGQHTQDTRHSTLQAGRHQDQLAFVFVFVYLIF